MNQNSGEYECWDDEVVIINFELIFLINIHIYTHPIHKIKKHYFPSNIPSILILIFG